MNEINSIIDSLAAKMNFMKGLVLLAKADGVVDQREKEFFMTVAVALGLDEESRKIILEMMDTSDISPDITFVNKQQTLFFIREALQLCYMDGIYDIKEKELIEVFRKNNNVSSESVKKIEQWVQKGITWKEEGADLLTLEQ